MSVITSMPMCPFIEPGIVGEDLFTAGKKFNSEHIKPRFAKFVLDGVH